MSTSPSASLVLNQVITLPEERVPNASDTGAKTNSWPPPVPKGVRTSTSVRSDAVNSKSHLNQVTADGLSEGITPNAPGTGAKTNWWPPTADGGDRVSSRAMSAVVQTGSDQPTAQEQL
eukprot:TRINITY_DN436_c1_g1_i6.p4 TRINITY_DN436_c1_g1~~TRINITY_DN436_c1_g1_i6.p4  ORF type:complete len:119 (-),score=3.97 TRINITY_DN436_c1_g1_i6:612-968(-)